MKQSTVIIALVLCCATTIYADCGAANNSERVGTKCYCLEGYWSTGDPFTTPCTKCGDNSYSSFPYNTAATINASICNSCSENHYLKTAATSTKNAICDPCPVGATSPAKNASDLSACVCQHLNSLEVNHTC